MKILIVDDKKENLLLLDTLLTGNGYEVETAMNGMKALDILNKTEINLIITDILMPVMDGYQLCSKVRKDKDLSHIPIIFYTATYTDQKDKELALKMGVNKFVEKPTDPQEFIIIVKKIINETNQQNSKNQFRLNKDEEVLKLYNERLVKKLEDKMLALEKAEKKFETLTENSPVGIFQTDAQGITTYVNPRWCEISGLSAEKALGDGWLQAVHPDDRKDLLEKWKTATKKQEISHSEYRFVHSDGFVRWVLGQAIPDRNDQGQIIGYIGTITDITEKKIIEKEYKQIIDAMNETAFVISFAGKFVEVNKTAIDVLGYSREEFLEMGPDDIDNQLSSTEVKKLRQGMPTDRLQVFETEHKTKKGNIIPVEISSSVVNYRGQKAILSIARNIARRKQAESALSESEERYRTLFETASDAIFMMKENEFITCNESTIQMFGCDSKEDVLDHSPWDFSSPIQPDGQNSKQKALNYIKAASAGKTQLFYWKHIKKDGTPFDAQVSLNKLTLKNKDYIQAIVRDITKKKKLENELRDSEIRYRTLFENSSEFLFTLDLKGNFTDVNKAAEILTGYSKSELLTMNFRDYTSKKDQRKLFRAFHNVYKTGETLRDIYIEAKVKDGSKRYFEVSFSLLRKKEKIIGIQGSSKDITEKKLAEESLKKSERKYRHHFENITDVIYSMDTNLITIDVSPSVEKILGYKPSELIGKPFQELNIIAPDSIEKASIDTIRVLQGEEIKSAVYQFIAKDGTKRWGEISGAPLIQNGKVVSTVSVARDITDRMEAELALRTSEAKLSNAVEIAKLGYWEYDVLNDIFTFNDQFYNIYRTTAEKAGGYTMSSEQYAKRFVHPDDMSLVGDEVKKAIETKDPYFSCQVEHRIIYEGGEIGYVVVRFFVVKDDKGRTVKTFGANQDITERKKYEKIQKTVFDIANALNTTKTMHDLYIKIKEHLGNVIDTTNFYIALYDKELDEISLPFVKDEKDVYKTFPAGKTLTKYVIQHGKPFYATKKLQNELTKKGVIEILGTPSKIWLGVPLRLENKVIGLMAVHSYDNPNLYSEKDLDILTLVSEQIALAINHKKAEEQIEKDLKEKTVLLQELYHRTKNNMQLIISMMRIQARQSPNEYLNSSFREIINRINSMSLVHQKLYQASDLSQINLKEYIVELIQQISRSYPQKFAEIPRKFEMADIFVTIDSAIPLGLVINELISNVFKHAFPENKLGEINVKLHEEKNGIIHITLADNGVGIPEDMNLRTINSMGMNSTFTIVENQLKGKISYIVDNGLKWLIEFDSAINKKRI